jgi:hypothetical protein
LVFVSSKMLPVAPLRSLALALVLTHVSLSRAESGGVSHLHGSGGPSSPAQQSSTPLQQASRSNIGLPVSGVASGCLYGNIALDWLERVESATSDALFIDFAAACSASGRNDRAEAAPSPIGQRIDPARNGERHSEICVAALCQPLAGALQAAAASSIDRVPRCARRAGAACLLPGWVAAASCDAPRAYRARHVNSYRFGRSPP